MWFTSNSLAIQNHEGSSGYVSYINRDNRDFLSVSRLSIQNLSKMNA